MIPIYKQLFVIFIPMKVIQPQSLLLLFFFVVVVSFLSRFPFTNIHESLDCRRKGKGISLTPHYHLHLLHRHLDSSRTITVEGSVSSHS